MFNFNHRLLSRRAIEKKVDTLMTPEFLCGISFVDRDHRQILRYLLRLEIIEIMGKYYFDSGKSNFTDLMHELWVYSIGHFSREESVMDSVEYESHHDHHVHFLSRLKELINLSREDGFELWIGIGMLRNWFINHIKELDIPYFRKKYERMGRFERLKNLFF